MASHIRKPVELFPISEFPLTDDSPSSIGMSDPDYHNYTELIQTRAEWDVDRSDWFYCLMDLDGMDRRDDSARGRLEGRVDDGAGTS